MESKVVRLKGVEENDSCWGGGEGKQGDRWRVCKRNSDEKNLNSDGNEKMGTDSRNRKREVR